MTCRYRLSVLATEPTPLQTHDKEASIELVFFGNLAEEIIGAPVHTILASQEMPNLLPPRITALYGRQLELRISVSRASFQRLDISYQVDGIIGAVNVPANLPAIMEPRTCCFLRNLLFCLTLH